MGSLRQAVTGSAPSFGTLSRSARLLAAGLGALGLAGCDDFRYPRDPNDTLDRVLATDRVRVAAVDHVPWVIVDGNNVPRGAEVDLIEAFARDLGATVEWRRAPAFEALDALERGDVDLAVGGFTNRAVTAHKGASHTYAYFTEALIVASEPGLAIPQRLDGQRVYVAPDLMADSLVRDQDGVPVSEKTASVRLLAVPEWLARARALEPTSIVLRRDEHVIAVPKGENAWVVRLERFLRTHSREIADRLREHRP